MSQMNSMRSISVFLIVLAGLIGLTGCAEKIPPYGTERQLALPAAHRQAWAVAPVLDLSGQQIDPILQADLVYQQLQTVHGLTVIPVNRVVEVFVGLKIEKIQTEQQAQLVCELLGCDALLVTSVTAFDPYNPPKVGAAMQLFAHGGSFAQQASHLDARELSRRASPPAEQEALPQTGSFLQAVGMYDAANGSVRADLLEYAKGRNDPVGPLKSKEYLMSADRYAGFAYHQLIENLLSQMRPKQK
jgi:hypothetical protein